jgi:hypothetical protein
MGAREITDTRLPRRERVERGLEVLTGTMREYLVSPWNMEILALFISPPVAAREVRAAMAEILAGVVRADRAHQARRAPALRNLEREAEAA